MFWLSRANGQPLFRTLLEPHSKRIKQGTFDEDKLVNHAVWIYKFMLQVLIRSHGTRTQVLQNIGAEFMC